MGITEIDPNTFASRGTFIRLDYGKGDAAPGEGKWNCGFSGMAARDGKLYVTFNYPPFSWLGRSAINTMKVDEKQTTTGELKLEQVLALLHARDEVSARRGRRRNQAIPSSICAWRSPSRRRSARSFCPTPWKSAHSRRRPPIPVTWTTTTSGILLPLRPARCGC